MKYFFSLYIILLNVWGNLYANTNPSHATSSLTQVLSTVHYAQTLVATEYDNVTSYFQATLEKENELVFATDNEVAEDEKLTSVKKDLSHSSYFTTVLYAEQLGCLCNNVKKRLIYSRLFVPIAVSKLNVLLGVYLI